VVEVEVEAPRTRLRGGAVEEAARLQLNARRDRARADGERVRRTAATCRLLKVVGNTDGRIRERRVVGIEAERQCDWHGDARENRGNDGNPDDTTHSDYSLSNGR